MPEKRKSVFVQEKPFHFKQKWLFILGIPRSGTTWLLSIFEKHSECLAVTPQMLNISVSAPTKETGLFVRGLNDIEIFERIQKLPFGRLLVEKTPSHLLVVPEIKKTIADVEFILIERHPLDIIYSMIQENPFWKDSPRSFEEAVNLYLKFYEAQLKNDTFFDYKISYEKLWLDPLGVLLPIFNSLDLNTSSLKNIIKETWGGKSLQKDLQTVFRKGEPGEGQKSFTEKQKNYFQDKMEYLKKNIYILPSKKAKKNHDSSKIKKPLKILLAMNYFKELTGSETYTLLLVKHLLEQGHEVEIYAHAGFGQPLYNGHPPLHFWTSQDIQHNHKIYDIIVTQHTTATSIILKKFNSTPAISINHGIISEENPQLATKLRHYICVSEEVANRAKEQFQIPERSISVVPNPIDLEYYDFSAEIPKTKNFLWAGSIYDWKIKSLETAIRMIQKLPGAKLYVAGQNAINMDFQNYSFVHYLGVQKITPEFLKQFCMVFGVGRLALEALAVGTPVFIMGKDGIDGLLDQENFFKFRKCNFSGRFNPKDYKEANLDQIAEKINAIISNQVQLKALKEQYFELRKETDASRIAKHIEDILYTIYQNSPSDATDLAEEKEVSIIIPVYNQICYTKKCLETIIKNTASMEKYEVIVVNNGSTDETEKYLYQVKPKISNLRIIQNYQNLGFARACNIGANAAYGKNLLFLNNDTEPQSGWLDEILNLFYKEKNIGIIGSKLLYPDRTVQHAGIEFHYRIFGNYKVPWPYHEFRGINENFSEINITKEVTAITGACLFMNKKLFKEIGGFSETYPMYFEDIDLNMKVRQQGKKIFYCHKSTVIHHEGKSSINQKNIDQRNLQSGELFIQRWGKEVKNLIDRRHKLKNHLIWSAPFFNPSGYASEAIGFALGLDTYADLQIYHANPIRSKNFLENMPAHWRETLSRLHSEDPYATSIRIPENVIFISHQPANSFINLDNAKYNIGRTMFETDRIPDFWVAYCNRMDEIWLPSQFNYTTFTKSGVLAEKIHIIPESIDTSVFDPKTVQPFDLPGKAKFNFLSIFEWTERKGWDVLLRAYFEAFSKKDDVCLYLRTYLLSQYDQDTENIIHQIINDLIKRNGYHRKNLPNYVILANQLPFEKMLQLYKAVDAFVLPSRGEGWGRPYMEAMCMGLPVIATNWSGNTAFMNDDNSFLIRIDGLEEIKKMEIPFYLGHQWAKPSKNHLKKLMREVFANPDLAQRKARTARRDIVEKFSLDAVAKVVIARLQEIEKKLEKPKTSIMSHKKSTTSSRAAHNVVWEGDQFVHHSLALVNRELSLKLIESGINLSIQPSKSSQYTPAKNSPYQKILNNVRKELPRIDVHVRHFWPPNLNPPEQGHWVMIQPWEFGSLPSKWAKIFSSDVDEMWVPSNYVREVYINSGISEDRVFTIPNGINPGNFHPEVKYFGLKTKKRFKFLFVGGTIYRKGIDLLIDSYLNVFNNSDDVCLVIKDMGINSFYQGQTLGQFISEIKKRADSPQIEYIEKHLSTHQLAGLYKSCDVLVHPFRGEGFGLPILESMACGTPAIVTEGGPVLDFCNKQNSLLVKAKKVNLPDKKVDNMPTVGQPWLFEVDQKILGNKMRYAYQNTDKIKKMGIKASQDVQANWTWDRPAALIRERLSALQHKDIKRVTKSPDSKPKMEESSLFLYNKAKNCYMMKKKMEALNILKQLIQIDSTHGEAYNLLGKIYLDNNDFQGAISFFELAIKNQTDNTEAQRNYGKTLILLKFYDQAIKTFNTILNLNKDDLDTFLLLVHAYQEKGDLDTALQILSLKLEKHQTIPELWEKYAILNRIKGDLNEYQRGLEKYLELRPQDAAALNELGVFYWQKENYDLAVSFFEKAVENNGHHAEHIKNLAEAYLSLERFEESIMLFKLLMEVYPQDFEAYDKLSALYIEDGNTKAAKDLINKYLSINNKDEKAKNILDILENVTA